jgi:hypothetical protein
MWGACWVGAVLLWAAAAQALVIGGEGPAGAPPPDEASWEHVGSLADGALTVIYLGRGWVLTADHVGVHDVRIGGRVYEAEPESRVGIYNPDKTAADLVVFRIRGNPELPDLPPLAISEHAPQVGSRAFLIGNGRFQFESRSLSMALAGLWDRVLGGGLSWGTNRIAEESFDVQIGASVTRALATDFSPSGDPLATAREAQAVSGDSGGALFVPADGGHGSELAGVVFAATRSGERVAFGSFTYAADLAHYREQILAAIEQGAADDVGAAAPPELAFVSVRLGLVVAALVAVTLWAVSRALRSRRVAREGS